MKFIIVGHIDHGKSTLIGRLLFDTASLPQDKIAEIEKFSKELGRETDFSFAVDYLQEEREQGITIDTTQIFFRTKRRQYVIIDAPGHVEFIKNMVTGASQAEAGILIIDVKEGVQEQTRRHAYILKILGISQVIVLLNKMDLVNFDRKRYAEVRKEAEEFLGSIGVRADYYIPVSALKGENIVKNSKKMFWYEGPIFVESLDSLKRKIVSEKGPLILPVQDIYKIDSERIIVGRIERGKIKKGEEIKILPILETTMVNSIKKFPEEVNQASAEESIGLTIQSSLFVERGMVICRANDKLKISDNFKANLFWMGKSPLNKTEELNLRCATQSTLCEVKKIYKRINSSTLEVIQENAGQLENLEVGEVEIKTKRAIVVERFNNIQEIGRFVLKQQKNICAGGIITEAG